MREYVEIVRWLQSGDQTPAKPTRLFKPTTAKLIGKLPSPSSKIFVASLNPKMTKLAGEVGDGVIFNFLIPSAVERKLVPLREGVKSSGRHLTSFEICTQLYVDHEYNEENLRRLIYFYSSSEAYRNHFASIGFEELASEMRKGWENDDKTRVMRAITSDVIQQLCVAGDKSGLVERIYALEKSGIQNIILAPNPYSDVEKSAGWAIQALSKEYGKETKIFYGGHYAC
jgi:alkanesulfonate monooxygenase SsuD/methylene tetrahydromethanopterin reductase-like flavin-dependent oxidoreductase (luciferase family)